jgi:hypothetical protein
VHGDRICNRDTGLCAFNPCWAGCGEGKHCEVAGAVPRCVESDGSRGPSASGGSEEMPAPEFATVQMVSEPSPEIGYGESSGWSGPTIGTAGGVGPTDVSACAGVGGALIRGMHPLRCYRANAG